MYFGNDGFMMDQGWTDQDMIDFCDYVSTGSYCSDFHVCSACNFAEYGPGPCFWDTYCAGCGAGGDNAYYYEAECACEGPETRPE